MSEAVELELAETIVGTMQEEFPALDAYDEDEIASFEAKVAELIRSALASPPEGEPVAWPDREAVAVLPLAAMTLADLELLEASSAVLIQSDNGFWRQNCAGYTTKANAAIYTGAEAYAATRHCGPEKEVRYHILAPSSLGPAATEGYKLVPVEPTGAQATAIAKAVREMAIPTSIGQVYFDNGHARRLYAALLSASDGAGQVEEPNP